jgi:hypothetical protein
VGGGGERGPDDIAQDRNTWLARVNSAMHSTVP